MFQRHFGYPLQQRRPSAALALLRNQEPSELFDNAPSRIEEKVLQSRTGIILKRQSDIWIAICTPVLMMKMARYCGVGLKGLGTSIHSTHKLKTGHVRVSLECMAQYLFPRESRETAESAEDNHV